jgi:predicted translin family RNA/ssDNA-binding protein
MEKNIKEAISIIEDVRKSMPECTNKAFLKGALNELNEALRLYAVSSSVCPCNELPEGEIAISSKALQKPYGDLGQTDC